MVRASENFPLIAESKKVQYEGISTLNPERYHPPAGFMHRGVFTRYLIGQDYCGTRLPEGTREVHELKVMDYRIPISPEYAVQVVLSVDTLFSVNKGNIVELDEMGSGVLAKADMVNLIEPQFKILCILVNQPRDGVDLEKLLKIEKEFPFIELPHAGE